MFIEDVRYTVPTIVFVAATDKERAGEIARMRLVESRHHLAVELRQDDKPLARFDRDGVLWFNEPE